LVNNIIDENHSETVFILTQLKKLLFSGIFLLLIFSPSHINGAVIATDDSNDVTQVTWNTNGVSWSVTESVSKPDIDITDIEYGSTAGGNRSLSISVVGTPVFNNETFYFVTLEDSDTSIAENNFSLIIWAGGYTGYSSENPASLLYTDETGKIIVFEVLQPEISGSKINFIFPKTISTLNLTTFSYDDVDLPLPETTKSTWNWEVWSWSGVNYAQNSGDWYVDYYPNNANPYVTGGADNTDGATSSGFEGMFIVFGFTLLVLINQKRRK
jgi:hypothetical protein